ncbi:hypothetical protein [Streptomyces tendae]
MGQQLQARLKQLDATCQAAENSRLGNAGFLRAFAVLIASPGANAHY